jgi:hypothetical protein
MEENQTATYFFLQSEFSKMADKRPKDIINFQHGYWKATKKQRFS